jgi:glutaredoxin
LFAGLNTQVLGISVDHVPCLQAWAESLGGISYPLLSDFWPHGAVCQQYGVLRPDGKAERALFVIDAEGVVRYIDIHDIDLQPENELLRQVIREVDPAAAASEPPYIPPEPVELPHGGIVMYCTPWCPDCKKARAWLHNHKLEYTEVNIPYTPGASEQVKRWAGGRQITPTFDIDGQIIVDFDVEKLGRALGIS